MLLAWKNAHRFELSTFLLIASVWAPLPSVSDSARNNAITAISSAIFLFSLEASLAWSACSMLSCALMILSLPEAATIAEQHRERKRQAVVRDLLGRFRAKACPGLDPGWTPVRVKKTRQIKKWTSIPILSEWKRLWRFAGEDGIL